MDPGKNIDQRPYPQVLEQRWFSGVHSNIGGGYPDSRISDIALAWMVKKGLSTGLSFDETYLSKNLAPDIAGTLYNSFVFPFSLLRPAKRVVNRNRIYAEVVDQSVFDLWKKDENYRPHNIRHLV